MSFRISNVDLPNFVCFLPVKFAFRQNHVNIGFRSVVNLHTLCSRRNLYSRHSTSHNRVTRITNLPNTEYHNQSILCIHIYFIKIIQWNTTVSLYPSMNRRKSWFINLFHRFLNLDEPFCHFFLFLTVVPFSNKNHKSRYVQYWLNNITSYVKIEVFFILRRSKPIYIPQRYEATLWTRIMYYGTRNIRREV